MDGASLQKGILKQNDKRKTRLYSEPGKDS